MVLGKPSGTVKAAVDRRGPGCASSGRKFGAQAVDAAVASLCKTVDDFTREAYRQLVAAYIDTSQV